DVPGNVEGAVEVADASALAGGVDDLADADRAGSGDGHSFGDDHHDLAGGDVDCQVDILAVPGGFGQVEHEPSCACLVGRLQLGHVGGADDALQAALPFDLGDRGGQQRRNQEDPEQDHPPGPSDESAGQQADAEHDRGHGQVVAGTRVDQIGQIVDDRQDAQSQHRHAE